MNIEKLSTEKRNPNTYNIDEMDSLAVVTAINEEDKKVAIGVEKELPSIAKAVDEISKRFELGGRIIYCGAGTSGRLGVLDAVELTPTYNVPASRAVGIIAGGEEAMYVAVEGAEDSAELAVEDMKKIDLRDNDSLLAIAASGRTPYTLAAIEYAKSKGILSVAITCNGESPMNKAADISIAPAVGPEAVTGSTRMKAGTAQKMVLNMISTAVMAKTGKLYSNLMVNVQATNLKLKERSINIVKDAANINFDEAKELFAKAGENISVAIVMYRTGADKNAGENALKETNNHIKKAIELLEEQK